MKKIKISALLIYVLGIFLGLAVSQKLFAGMPANNLIKNAIFAEGQKYWHQQGKGRLAIQFDDRQLILQKQDSQYSAFYQDIKIPAPGKYFVELVADSKNGNGALLLVTPFSNGKFHDRQNIRLSLLPKNGVQDLSKEIKLGSEVSKVRIRLFGNKNGTRFISVQLKKMTAADKQPNVAPAKQLNAAIGKDSGNLLKNSNFKAGKKYWSQVGSGKSDIRIENGKLLFQRQDAVYSVLYQDIKIPSPGTYALEVTADSRNGGGSQVIVTPFFDGKFHDRYNSYIRLDRKNGVQKLSKLINIGAEVSKVRVRIIGNKTGTLFSKVILKKTFPGRLIKFQ